jgi:hypothetical protein
MVCVQIGNMRKEHLEWRRPEDVTTQEFVGYVALEESPSDLAGQVVAAMVSSGLALLEYAIAERSVAVSLVLLSCSCVVDRMHSQLCVITMLLALFQQISFHDITRWLPVIAESYTPFALHLMQCTSPKTAEQLLDKVSVILIQHLASSLIRVSEVKLSTPSSLISIFEECVLN